jgi:hypothetical protein
MHESRRGGWQERDAPEGVEEEALDHAAMVLPAHIGHNSVIVPAVHAK